MSASGVATRRPKPAPSLRRELRTPEGVPLQVELSAVGDRAGALLLDLLMSSALLLGFALATIPLWKHFAGAAGFLLFVAAFVLRGFYFTLFELLWRGRTPGKRAMKLRVVDAEGGGLTARAVVARNAMREVELFLPLSLLAAPSAMASGGFPLLGLFCWLWIFALMLMPLLNRDKRRVGDLVGGTLVIRAPQALLLDDLSTRGSRRSRSYSFTREQLSVYGIYELQVLEGVLRQGAGPKNQPALTAVAARIREKLGVVEPVSDPYPFLRDFYAALRGHLESGLLQGRRKANKLDVGGKGRQ